MPAGFLNKQLFANMSAITLEGANLLILFLHNFMLWASIPPPPKINAALKISFTYQPVSGP